MATNWSVDGWKVQDVFDDIGASGGVFRAVNDHGVVGVLKVCVGAEDGEAERLLRELNALTPLLGTSVPNVAEILDAGRTREGAGYFVVSAFVAGSFLRPILDEVGTLSLSTAIAMIQGLARGLAHLHRMGFACPDINPSEIVIPHERAFEDATLVDFSPWYLSRSTIGLATQDRRTFGTLAYIHSWRGRPVVVVFTAPSPS